MNDELLPYYDRELIFVRKIAAEFAAQYPERAAALRLSRDGCDDPHVERILEAFALVAGRIQHKLDEEFPEITGALLELLYPHLLRPVPSVAMLQFEVDPELGRQRDGHLVPRGTTAYSAPMNGVQCRFRTTYPVRLWPLEVVSAAFGSSSDVAGGIAGQEARHALRIELRVRGSKLSAFDLKDLRFHIAGDPQAANWIYELLFNKVKRIFLRPLDKDGRPDSSAKTPSALLPPNSVRQVGFSRDEALLPTAETSFQGYRLLQEYFCFPEKFLFFDVAGLDALPLGPQTDRFEIVFLLSALEQTDRAVLLESAVHAGTFELGCTPAINLFERTASPIRLSHTKTEYPVVPDVYAPLGYEVYSIDRVLAHVPNTSEPKEYRPFYSFRPSAGQGASQGSASPGAEAFWFSARRPSVRGGDAGSDVFLSVVDRDFKLSEPASESITMHITCSNRDFPSRLPINRTWGDLDLETGAMVRTRVVSGPTETIRPSFRGSLQWQLISQLSLNHLSLVDSGVDALREILRLHDPASNHATSRQIDGIVSVRSGRKIARLSSEHGFVFCQGLAIDVEFDEEKFPSGGAYLLASILERFFGLYCAVNSFTQLRVSARQRRELIWQWPIRSGEQAVA